MIEAVICDGEYEHLKDNTIYTDIIKKLEESSKQYLVGIDLPKKGYNDYPVLTYMRFDKVGGNLTVEGSLILE